MKTFRCILEPLLDMAELYAIYGYAPTLVVHVHAKDDERENWVEIKHSILQLKDFDKSKVHEYDTTVLPEIPDPLGVKRYIPEPLLRAAYAFIKSKATPLIYEPLLNMDTGRFSDVAIHIYRGYPGAERLERLVKTLSLWEPLVVLRANVRVNPYTGALEPAYDMEPIIYTTSLRVVTRIKNNKYIMPKRYMAGDYSLLLTLLEPRPGLLEILRHAPRLAEALPEFDYELLNEPRDKARMSVARIYLVASVLKCAHRKRLQGGDPAECVASGRLPEETPLPILEALRNASTIH